MNICACLGRYIKKCNILDEYVEKNISGISRKTKEEVYLEILEKVYNKKVILLIIVKEISKKLKFKVF